MGNTGMVIGEGRYNDMTFLSVWVRRGTEMPRSGGGADMDEVCIKIAKWGNFFALTL
jgi:hypothetical protein